MARRISEKDFDLVAEYVREEKDRRERLRGDFDRSIKEVDRQVQMKPRTDHKEDQWHRRDPRKDWLPEFELPLQAEALETITSDARSMMFPDTGAWFTSHALLTDRFLNEVDFESIIAGDETDVPTRITQDAVDKYVQSFLQHFHRQYDFRGHIDTINAEAVSYGTGLGRGKIVKKSVVLDSGKGLVKQDQFIPVLIPTSIKNTYLDDREYAVMHDGHMVGPMHIIKKKIFLEDLIRQAKSGDKDPENVNGGWIPKAVAKLEEDDKGFVELLEAEGDFVIPRKTTGSIFIPNVIVTVATGKNATKLIRLRFKKFPFGELIIFPYHKESVENPYGCKTSPLMKGMPLQAAAVEMLMRIAEVAALNAQPPVGYDRNDMWFAQNGGPIIAPGAQWGTIGDINVYNGFGSIGELNNVYFGILQQYADVVGVHRARLGAQTVSHTTAFAKNVEIQRGAVRTVDYVRSTMQGPITQWLDMEYQMARQMLKGKVTYYVEAYNGYVEVGKKNLPDSVIFEAFGSAGPQEEQQKRAEKLAALNNALQIDQLNISLGGQPKIDIGAIIEETLSQGGWTDIDKLLLDDTADIAGETLPSLPAAVSNLQ